jgi:hypothetical protein
MGTSTITEWQQLDGIYSLSEFDFKLWNWKAQRRFVVVRELISMAAVGVSFLSCPSHLRGLLGTWFSSARIAEVERQIVKLQRNRGRIQRRRRASDRYDVR